MTGIARLKHSLLSFNSSLSYQIHGSLMPGVNALPINKTFRLVGNASMAMAFYWGRSTFGSAICFFFRAVSSRNSVRYKYAHYGQRAFSITGGSFAGNDGNALLLHAFHRTLRREAERVLFSEYFACRLGDIFLMPILVCHFASWRQSQRRIVL